MVFLLAIVLSVPLRFTVSDYPCKWYLQTFCNHISQCLLLFFNLAFRGGHGRGRLVLGFTITYAISPYHH